MPRAHAAAPRGPLVGVTPRLSGQSHPEVSALFCCQSPSFMVRCTHGLSTAFPPLPGSETGFSFKAFSLSVSPPATGSRSRTRSSTRICVSHQNWAQAEAQKASLGLMSSPLRDGDCRAAGGVCRGVRCEGGVFDGRRGFIAYPAHPQSSRP